VKQEKDSPPLPDADKIVLIPVEDYISIMRSLDRLEQARDEFRKIGVKIKQR